MEKATLTSIGWTIGKNDVLLAKPATVATTGISGNVQVKRRFQFSSALKRQSSVATISGIDNNTGNKLRGTFVGVKGAPETIMKRLTTVPADYEETYKYFTRRGSRVLALAYKQLSTEGELSSGKINDLKREQVECGLTFAGFLVLSCPLKEDAKEAVQMLNESSHRVVMITGDNPLTAVYVARDVEIVDRDVLILDAPEDNDDGDKLVWRSVDDKTSIPVDPTKPIDPEIIKTKDLCVTGYALAKFKGQQAWFSILRHTWVYARVSPKQKEDILLGLKEMGYYTLMAGDGTNDVGALKQAHIGVALLNGTQEDLVRIAEHSRNTRMKDIYQKQVEMMKRFNQPAPPVPVLIAHMYPPGPSNPNFNKAVEREAQKKNVSPEEYVKAQGYDVETITSPAAQQLINSDPKNRNAQAQKKAANLADRMTTSLMENELDDNEPPTLKLGDASVAAPFTSKLRNVIAVPNIIRQGRCTLVATIQMYKILALNCLITAYSLSVLYLEGIKFGDGQYTISGVLMSVCFLSLSRARVVEGLSKERPQPNIFNFYIIGSILGQFAIHIVTLIYVARLCDRLEPRSDNVDLEAEFSPSLLNSAVYLLQLIQQISTFAINYQGRPFRESLSENRGMFWGILGVSALAFSCAMELAPEINEQMKLVPFTDEFKTTMTSVMVFDYAACWTIEVVLKRLFSDFRPRDIADRRPDQLEREKVRKAEATQKLIAGQEKAEEEKIAALEKQIADRRQQVANWRRGGPAQ
ncbi:Manganese-transporting ATPase 4 like protein [Verticillium longisporum]|nr:Manganese-transporting ATPase 4 like protein [Verticillium longisporum]